MGVLTAHRANRVISLPIAAGFVATPAALMVAGSVMVQQGMIIAGAGTIAAGLMAGAITDTYVHYRGLQVEREAEIARANARTPEIRAFDTQAEAEYQPGMVYVPLNGYTATLHITPAQFKVLKRRIRANQLGLPVNNLEGFTTTETKRLRDEMLYHKLAETHGQTGQVRLTQEGVVALMQSSPAGVVKA